MEALKEAVASYESAAAELQSTNHELSEALQAVQQHAQAMEVRLADEQAAAAAQQQQRVAQLEEAGIKLEEVLASRLALQAQLGTAAEQQRQLLEQARAEREAAAAAAQRERQAAGAAAAQTEQLMASIRELETRKPVHLSLSVSHEAEWRAEAVRAAALEARAGELQGRVSAYQRQARLEAAWWVPPAWRCFMHACGGAALPASCPMPQWTMP